MGAFFLQSFRHSGTRPWMNKPLLTLYPRNKMAHLYSQQGQNLNLIDRCPSRAGICVVWVTEGMWLLAQVQLEVGQGSEL